MDRQKVEERTVAPRIALQTRREFLFDLRHRQVLQVLHQVLQSNRLLAFGAKRLSPVDVAGTTFLVVVVVVVVVAVVVESITCPVDGRSGLGRGHDAGE